MKLDFQYFVVRFLEKPLDSVPDYVYIPSKWIKNIVCVENKVEVAYPTGDGVIAEELIEHDINFDNNWKVWPAKLVCGCDSYTDAQKNLETINIQLYRQLRNNRLEEDTQTLNTNEDEEKNAAGLISGVQTKEVTENALATAETISGRPHQSKYLRKRSLSLNSLCRTPRKNIKKARTKSTDEIINNKNIVNADTTKQKITPLFLSKINTSHKTEYVIINDNNYSINPVHASREQSPVSSTASEFDDEYLTNLCNDLLNMKDWATKLFNNFDLLSNNLLENRRTCTKICSILKDLRSLCDSDEYITAY